VLGLSGIRWPAVGEGREWGKLIGGGDSDCRWEAAICESKSREVERDRPDGRRSAFVVGGGNWWWSEALLGGGRLWWWVAGEFGRERGREHLWEGENEEKPKMKRNLMSFQNFFFLKDFFFLKGWLTQVGLTSLFADRMRIFCF
jgi:hypothetical protein